MQTITLRRPDGNHRTVSGYRLGGPRAGTTTYQPDERIRALPPRVDLRPQMTPVEDQQTTNSCAANATAGAYEYLMKRALGDEAYDVSRLFIYFNARAEDGVEGQDEGATLGAVIASLQKSGACSEQSWPFDPGIVNEPPAEETYEEAAQFLVQDCKKVPTNLEAWKMALAAGNPIIFGLKLFDSFDRHKKPGAVPMPTSAESGRDSHGGHAMLCVGYSDPDEVFIVRNSWGPSWGDGGYCYIPYRYAMNPAYNFDDSWIIEHVDVAEIDESTWGDETSILPEVDTTLGNMDDEAYGAMLDAMGEVPFEQRLGLLFLRAAASDGELGEGEVARAAELLAPVLQQVGSPYDAQAVLENTVELVSDDTLVEESLDAFGRSFPADALATVANQLQEVCASDGESDEENEFVAAVMERWQLAG